MFKVPRIWTNKRGSSLLRLCRRSFHVSLKGTDQVFSTIIRSAPKQARRREQRLHLWWIKSARGWSGSLSLQSTVEQTGSYFWKQAIPAFDLNSTRFAYFNPRLTSSVAHDTFLFGLDRIQIRFNWKYVQLCKRKKKKGWLHKKIRSEHLAPQSELCLHWEHPRFQLQPQEGAK